jgi:hypothetical protein
MRFEIYVKYPGIDVMHIFMEQDDSFAAIILKRQ